MTWSRSKHTQPPDWRRRKAAVLAAHAHLCHVCRHGGAEQVDHVLNQARGGSDHPDNLAPIHQAPCPTCGQRCHVAKTAAESVAARAAQGLTRKRPTEPHPSEKRCDTTGVGR